MVGVGVRETAWDMFSPGEDRVYCTGDIFHLAMIRYIVDSDSSYTVLQKCHEGKGYPSSLWFKRSEPG